MSVLIAAIDVPDAAAARSAVAQLPQGVWLKIGLELFTAEGPALVRELAAQGWPIFLDMKFHDIPNTVRGACRSAARLGVRLVTLHVEGGPEMAEAAMQGAAQGAALAGLPAPQVLGITVLTSGQAGSQEETQALVVARALQAKASGLDGVVCSGLEAAAVKAACGANFVCLCPGIRFAGSVATQDQKRVCTPGEAVAAGADYLVMGRPLLGAESPQAAAMRALAEMQKSAVP